MLFIYFLNWEAAFLTPVSLHISPPASKQLEASVARRRGQPAVGVRRSHRVHGRVVLLYNRSYRSPEREKFYCFRHKMHLCLSASTGCNIANSPTGGTFLVCQPLVFSWPPSTHCPGHPVHTARDTRLCLGGAGGGKGCSSCHRAMPCGGEGVARLGEYITRAIEHPGVPSVELMDISVWI